jgi:putative FmdB family regulatory protein
MPLYEYTCRKCDKTFTLLQKPGATEKDTTCIHCGSRDVSKLISSFSCSTSGLSTGSSSGFSSGSV